MRSELVKRVKRGHAKLLLVAELKSVMIDITNDHIVCLLF